MILLWLSLLLFSIVAAWLAGERAGKRDGDRRVWACKVYWQRKLDEQAAETREFSDFASRVCGEAVAENMMLKSSRWSVGQGVN